jgi:hypothetical protein
MPTCVSPERVHACSHGASLKDNHAKSSEARTRCTDADRQATCSCCSRLGPAYKFSHTPCRARQTGVAQTTANQRGSDHGLRSALLTSAFSKAYRRSLTLGVQVWRSTRRTAVQAPLHILPDGRRTEDGDGGAEDAGVRLTSSTLAEDDGGVSVEAVGM